jgi:hypothetical protein
MTLQSIEIILSKLNYTKANVMTRQGYSFASHLNWYFTEKPRTTGIVGGDNFVFDITAELNKSVINKNLPSNRRSAAQKISELFKEFDSNYRAVLEDESCGNQICFEITC